MKNGWLGKVFEVHAVMSRYDGDNTEYRRWLSQFKGGAMYIFAGYLDRPDRHHAGETGKSHAFHEADTG